MISISRQGAANISTGLFARFAVFLTVHLCLFFISSSVFAGGIRIKIPGVGSVDVAVPAVKNVQQEPPASPSPVTERSENSATVFPAGTGPGTGVFTTIDNISNTFLSESSGEKFSIEFSRCRGGLLGQGPEMICGGRYQWGARECWGNTLQGEILRDGSLLFKEVTANGNCSVMDCSIVLLPGWARYQRICKRNVFSFGRFDKGRNVDRFADNINKSDFYKDPGADNVAAAIPKPPYRLEHDSEKFKAADAAISPSARAYALRATSLPPKNLDPREIANAIIAIDSKGWNWDTFIPGSIHDVSSSISNEGLVIDAKLVHRSLATNNQWAADQVRIVLKNGDMPCILYWNNSSCSANYALAISPSANTALGAADRKCIKETTQEYEEVIPSTCLIWDPKLRQCGIEKPAESVERQRQVWRNTCSRKINVVFNCQPFFRKSVVFEPGQTYQAACLLERVISAK